MKTLESAVLERMEKLKVAPESDSSPYNEMSYHGGSKKAIFLDMDGVMIEDGHPDSLKGPRKMIPGSADAMKAFRNDGFILAVVTNQGSIGMGRIDHMDLLDALEIIWTDVSNGNPWDRAYYCPYHPDSVLEQYRIDSIERKPGAGMLIRAASELDIDLSASIMIGDHLKDIVAGHSAGCFSILVCTGRGNRQLKKIIDENIGKSDIRYPDMIAEDLLNAYHGLKEMNI